MVKITFLDSSELIIHSNTVVNGYNRLKEEGSEYYLSNVFTDSIDGQFSTSGSLISTAVPKIGIAGLILSVDCFSVGLNTDDNVLYFSSAVKSVENL